MLRKLFLSTVIIAISSTITFAADPVMIDEGRFDWSGGYLGASAGYGTARLDGLHDSNSSAPNFQVGSDLNLEGFTGGVYAGYQIQSDNLVYGLEADITFMNWSDSLRNPPPTLDGGIDASVDWIATLRGRFGVANHDTLAYITGGVAYAKAEWSAIHLLGAAQSGTTSIGEIGYVIGGGFEKALDSNWIVRVEGLYFGFNDRKSTANLSSDSDPNDFAKFNNAWTVKAGIGYKF